MYFIPIVHHSATIRVADVSSIRLYTFCKEKIKKEA